MRGTQHLKIVWAMVAATGKGLLVVEFQPLTRLAASRLCVDKSALVPIALTHRALDWGRDGASAIKCWRPAPNPSAC